MPKKGDMKTIDQVFDRMDQWRHFPSYQLERRADLYFAMYLPEVLSRYLDISIKADIIPEFPIRIGTINEANPNESRPAGDKSYKVDYVALSQDGRKAVLVELKTEMQSKRDEQDEYLFKASRTPFPDLVEGIKDIFIATTLKRKYYCLRLSGKTGSTSYTPADENNHCTYNAPGHYESIKEYICTVRSV